MHLTSHDLSLTFSFKCVSKTHLTDDFNVPDEFSPYSFRHDWDDWVSSTDIEAKLQSIRRPRRTQRSLGEESGVNFELKEFASIPADVPIFEAIKKELDARVMEISGMANLFKEKPRFLP